MVSDVWSLLSASPHNKIGLHTPLDARGSSTCRGPLQRHCRISATLHHFASGSISTTRDWTLN